MHEMMCTVCGNVFQAKRSDARLCSSACRKEAERRREVSHLLDNAINLVDKMDWVLHYTSARSEAEQALRELQDRIDEALDQVS